MNLSTLHRMAKPFTEFDWHADFSPLYGTPLILPPHTIIWRGYDTRYPILSERPAYFSSMFVASAYQERDGHHDLSAFLTTRSLRILDFHFMKNLLTRMIDLFSDRDDRTGFNSVIIGFGLCSLRHQINLLKYRHAAQYKDSTSRIGRGIRAMEAVYRPHDIIEQPGFRVGITSDDGHAMAFLKEIFEGHFDGYIAPVLNSPFYVDGDGQIFPELVLFNPIHAGLYRHSTYPQPLIKARTNASPEVRLSGTRFIPIQELLQQQFTLIRIPASPTGFPTHNMEWFHGGGGHLIHPLDEYERIARTQRGAARERRIRAAAKKIRQQLRMYSRESPTPQGNPEPWTSSTLPPHMV